MPIRQRKQQAKCFYVMIFRQSEDYFKRKNIKKGIKIWCLDECLKEYYKVKGLVHEV
jgi:hypothetical protein